jgi:hypothetical protein
LPVATNRAPLPVHWPQVAGPTLLIVGSIITAQALAPGVVWDRTREDGALEFVNRQDEINLHNTEILHHRMRPLSLLVAGVLAVGLPALTRQRWKIVALVRRLDLPYCPTRLAWAWPRPRS